MRVADSFQSVGRGSVGVGNRSLVFAQRRGGRGRHRDGLRGHRRRHLRCEALKTGAG